ncbi:GntR family transcriptional regulator [Iamia majanohamensis]|uniref:GntR family transcriptional regulator n=1 Tax=Iamia majanohamensis TaxID=467976 RepID=A0AAE9Y8F6_9ACTN|nr:GntR family transcriptional regulator [Iamia majanohamensis]WCO68779.1 GntR family transcriptional regulator [Iamia majanohamensis]
MSDARPPDRRSPLPLWSQVADDLRRRLDAGEFASHFPGDVELMGQYDVSRHTVRDAVRRLQEAGLVVRERGRGTHVRSPGLEQPLGTLYSLYSSIEEQGHEQRSIVRALEERTDAEAARTLGLDDDAPLVYLERLRQADGRAVALDCSWLPAAVARPLLDADLGHTALYAELQERCGVRPRSGWERIRPALPTAEQRRLLGTAARQPVFAIERVTDGPDGPLEWRHSVVRGDVVAFVARWSEGDGTTRTSLEAAPASA